MDRSRLVEEISKKVMDRINDLKPKILVLNQEHSRLIFKSEKFCACYWSDDGSAEDKSDVLGSYEAVVLLQLTCDTMTQIASGVVVTDDAKLVFRALLMGKKIYIPKESIELFLFKNTAPDSYYAMLLEKLNILAAAGVTFCAMDELEEKILAKKIEPIDTGSVSGEEVFLDKKVITEKDVMKVCRNEMNQLYVTQRAIVTELAYDYARKRGVDIIRKKP